MRISDWSSDVCSSDLAANVVRDLPKEALAFLQTPAERFDKPVEPLAPLDLRGALVVVRQRWRNGQPEPDEQGQRFRRDTEIALQDRKSTRLKLQSLMRISYAVFCLKKKNINHRLTKITTQQV